MDNKKDYIHGIICHTSQNCMKCILQKSITGYDCTHIDVELLEKFYDINKVIPECKRPGSYCKYCPYIVMKDICFKKNYDLCISRNKQDQNKELDWTVVIENGKRVFKK
jgi:hypothetical protein